MSRWQQILAQAAPILGSLLGPMGASAGQLLGKALLGNAQASDTEIEKAILNPSPEQLITLRQMEADLQQKLAQYEFDENKLSVDDKENARSREIQVHDRIPAILAVLLTTGFFCTLFALMFWPVQVEARRIIDMMLGALGTAWVSCISYYFGSSYGSQIRIHPDVLK